MSARSTLELLGWQPHRARNLALRFRRHNVEQLAAIAPHRKDEARLIAAAKQGRQQLEELFALERQQAASARRARAGAGPRIPSDRERDDARHALDATGPEAGSLDPAGLLERQARAAREQLRRVAVAEVADEVRADRVPAQNAASIFAWSKPLIGPQSRPTARAAMMK